MYGGAVSESEKKRKALHDAISSHLEAASKGPFEPDASLADDALVNVPCLVATAQNYVTEVPGVEETAIDVRSSPRIWWVKLKAREKTHLKSLTMNLWPFSELSIFDDGASPSASGCDSESSG